MPRKGDKTGYDVFCENCGKPVYKTKYQFERSQHHFCSNACQKIFQHNLLFEVRVCEICGSEFEVSKKSTQRFCSVGCQHQWQGTRVGDKNPKYRRIQYACDWCNKDIYIMPCEERLFKHHFCSDDCRVKWYANIFSQDPKWREESKIRGTSLLSNGTIDRSTKPQIIINKLLDNLNIDYINEYSYKYYAVDNYLPKYNLIIEVMGDFWHSNPIKYSYDSLRPVQKKILRKDKAKHTYIKNNYNIEILYVWENDIYNNIELCEELIEQYIASNGTLNNYHSFNYNIVHRSLMIKNNIILSYQSMTQ